MASNDRTTMIWFIERHLGYYVRGITIKIVLIIRRTMNQSNSLTIKLLNSSPKSILHGIRAINQVALFWQRHDVVHHVSINHKYTRHDAISLIWQRINMITKLFLYYYCPVRDLPPWQLWIGLGLGIEGWCGFQLAQAGRAGLDGLPRRVGHIHVRENKEMGLIEKAATAAVHKYWPRSN
jgi:hypothetical protein